jgi:predicted nucleotide-binding protein (sugar kinase/HSP70/actin superfamily)
MNFFGAFSALNLAKGMNVRMKIGIPNALLHSYYITFWKTFFEELGQEPIETSATNKAILDKGVRHSVPEICVPMKIYTGHVVELLDRQVDYVYIPRFVSIGKGDTFCPKFLGLPDMLKQTVPGLEAKMLTHHIQTKTDDITAIQEYIEIAKIFTDDRCKIKHAIEKGRQKWLSFRDFCCKEQYDCRQANRRVLTGSEPKMGELPLKIGVIGYVYNIYDNFISMDILNKLRQIGAHPVTFEMLAPKVIDEQLSRFPKTLFWTFSNKLLAGAYHFFEDSTFDGVIHVTAFGCGPDSFLGKILELDSAKYQKPFMTVRIDEHTGENHLQTRVEAFVDMIAKKKSKMECA